MCQFCLSSQLPNGQLFFGQKSQENLGCPEVDMAESLLVRAQATGGSSGTQLVIGPALQGSASRNNPYTINSSSILMAAVKVYNVVRSGWTQASPEWFIIVVGDSSITLPITMIYNTSGSTSAEPVAYATLTTTDLTIRAVSTNYSCSVSGRIFCTA